MKRPTLTVLLVTTVLFGGGCTAIRDGVAWLIGAPSSTVIKAEQAKLATAEQEIDTLERRQAGAERQAKQLEAVAATVEARKVEVRNLYARMASELATLEGAAADAMIETLASLQHQLEAIGAQSEGALTMAASYRAQAEELIAAQDEAYAVVRLAEANLVGYETATQAAIAGVLDTVGIAGDTAASLGVPGARETAGTIGRIAEGILGTVLLSGTVGGGLVARRRKKQRDHEARKAENLGRIVTAVEKFGLIGMPPGEKLEVAKEGAKEWAGDEAHKLLKRTLIDNGNAAAA